MKKERESNQPEKSNVAGVIIPKLLTHSNTFFVLDPTKDNWNIEDINKNEQMEKE
ncbi:hypothetical protein ABNR98_004440 [Salmonella enterica]